MTAAVTLFILQRGIVASMDTRSRHRRPPRKVFLREWRKFMGTKATDLAEALDIERESYYRLERAPYKINNEEMVKLAETLGIQPNQFWFHPPTQGATERVSIDDLLEDVPETTRDMAILAVRGMIGK